MQTVIANSLNVREYYHHLFNSYKRGSSGNSYILTHSIRGARGNIKYNHLTKKGPVKMKSSVGNASVFVTIKQNPEISVNMKDYIFKIFKDLQQGSDVRGIAMKGIAEEPITLTSACVYFIANAFSHWLSKKLSKPIDTLKVSIGRDPRLSGVSVRNATAAGLAFEKTKVADFGLASTPAMYMSCIMPDHGYDGAIMITASHLPFNRNGMKFFVKDGGLDKPDIKEILEIAANLCLTANIDPMDEIVESDYVVSKSLKIKPSLIKKVDFMPVYSEHLRNIIKKSINSKENPDKPLTGFKIAVDAGNGSGGFFARDILMPLGADISGSQFLEPDGNFPNHIPNPEDAGAAASCTAAVLSSSSDLGIIFDTDVDRSGVIDTSGKAINSNRMIALMSAIVLEEHPGTTIVTDSVTSNGLKKFIEEKGGKHFRYKRGYKNVIGKGIELNSQGIQTELMMETSGHGALKENFFMDDGAYMSVKIVVELVRRHQKGLSGIKDIIENLKEPLEAKEFRIKIKDKNFKEIAIDTTERFRRFVESGKVKRWEMEKENYEGWRVSVIEEMDQRGWCLLRPSIHDPLCVLNIESEVTRGLRQTAKELKLFFDNECSDLPLDLSSLEAVLSD